MKKLFVILGLFLTFICAFSFSDFHSSITKIDYNESDKTLKFTVKMSLNDLLQSIRVDYNDPNSDDVVKKYVEGNFSVYINDSVVNFSFNGCQVNGQTVWVYFQSAEIGYISSIKVKSTILLKEFSNQKNLIIISYKGKQKTMNLQRGNEIGEIHF